MLSNIVHRDLSIKQDYASYSRHLVTGHVRYLNVGRGGLDPPGRANQGESGVFRTL